MPAPTPQMRQIFRTSLPRPTPINAPAATSDPWWIFTWTRLDATMAASEYQNSFEPLPRPDDSSVAAMKPDVAWPLGNDDDCGFRRVRSACSTRSGRSRRNSDFTPRLMSADSTPSEVESRTD